MHNFTPISALFGGALIGLSVAMLWLTKGRIAGISGILGGLLGASQREAGWRLAFLAGLLCAAPLMLMLGQVPVITVEAGGGTLIAAGLLVGFGTRLGGGCTSGHGICGMARMSARSIVATLLFMASAAVTVFVTHHVIGG